MRSFHVGVFIVALLAPSAALADDCHDIAKLKKDGNTAFGAAHYDEALASYTRAYACDKDTSLLFNMAKAELQIGQYVAGLDSMRRFQSESSKLPPEIEAAVSSTLADLTSHVGTLSVHAPAGATVSVDDHDIGTAPIESFEIAAGSLSVRVVASGHDPVVRKVDLLGGKHELVDIVFSAPAPIATKAPDAPPVKSARSIHPLVWAGAGVGVAGLIVGAVGGGLSLSTVNDLKKICPESLGDNGHVKCPTNVDAEKSKANTLANVSNVGFAFAGAGAILAGVGIGLSFRHNDETAHVTVLPTGLALEGSF
jgi:hypothetical protein